MPPVCLGEHTQTVLRLTNVFLPFGGFPPADRIRPGYQAARVDRIEGGVRAVGGAGELRQLPHEIGLGELLSLKSLVRERIDILGESPNISDWLLQT